MRFTKPTSAATNCRVAAQAADHLDQTHQWRRIEEMQAADALRPFATGRDLGDRQRRRIGGEHASAGRRFSSSRNNSRLTSKSSTIASMAMPAPFASSRESIGFRPVEHVLFGRGRHALFGNQAFKAPIDRRDCGLSPHHQRESNSSVVRPACAHTCAMPRPMVPAPKTATIRSGFERSIATRYCPSNFGFRFSMNARMPSF